MILVAHAFRLFVPKQAVGANLVYFDLFNAATSTARVDVVACAPVVSGAAQVAGQLGVDLFLTRTAAIGTGGTAATTEGTALDAMTVTSLSGVSLPAGISARLTPSGGATAGALISWRSVFTEETAEATYAVPNDMVHTGAALPPVQVYPGTGIRVVQGSVASVGNIGFDVVFNVGGL